VKKNKLIPSAQVKTIFFRIFLFAFLFSAFSSFAQTFTKKRGKVTTHYEDGKKEAAGKVKKYQKQGVWKYWGEDGHLKYTTIYKDDVKNGLYTEYFTDGTKSMEGNYVNGMKDGIWHTWFTGDNYESETSYKNGKFDGVNKYWYQNRQLRMQEKYSNDTIQYNWSWYDHGGTKAVEYYTNGLKSGTWRVYPNPKTSSDTFPSRIDHYENGMRNGFHTAYRNGKISEEAYYKNDVLNGSSKTWNVQGLLIASENYKDGNLDGISNYYETGLIRSVQYSKGKKNGVEKQVDAKGNPLYINWYKQGVLDSVYTYHPNGKIATSRIYKYYPGFVRTEEFSFYTEWDDAGNILLKGRYHFGEKDQDWTTYYPNGKIKSVTPYSSGKIKGIYKKWYANGKEMIEFECDDANVISTPKVWDEKGKPLKSGTNAYQEIVDSSLPGEIYNDPQQYKDNKRPIHFITPPIIEEEQIMDQSTDNVIVGDGEVYSDEVSPISEPAIADTNEVFTYVEEMPEFPGDSLIKFIKSAINYKNLDPEKMGKVYISFIVEKDGSITNIESVKDIQGAPEFTKEAIRVISLMPKWKPGKMNGRAVSVKMIEPVSFYSQQ